MYISGLNWIDACNFDTCCYPCAFGPGGLCLVLSGIGACLPCFFKKYQRVSNSEHGPGCHAEVHCTAKPASQGDSAKGALLTMPAPSCFRSMQMCQRPVYGKKGTDITKLVPHSSHLYLEGVHECKE